MSGSRRLGLFAVAALFSLPASAQNIAGSWEITDVGGGYFGRQICHQAALPRRFHSF